MKYPYLEKWISDRGLSVNAFAKLCGVHRTTMSKILNGVTCESIKKETIDKILYITGLKYEIAFAEVVIR